MEKNFEIKISLMIFVSLFLHIIIMVGLFSPDFNLLTRSERLKDKLFGGRDIIVNINQDDRKIVNSKTLLSDRDSYAKGFVTQEKGDHWLNNSLRFMKKKGSRQEGKRISHKYGDHGSDKVVVTDDSEIIVSIMRYYMGDESLLGEEGDSDFTRIPDRNSFNRKNAIFYSNDGRFSFNTKKFKAFKYFRDMKDKIASNWFPPPMANAAFGGYAPGRTRIIAIPSQLVKIFFIMNRRGEVLDVRIFESMGNQPLDDSCVKSIKDSRSFGTVPQEIKGSVIIIPFMFGYFVY